MMKQVQNTRKILGTLPCLVRSQGRSRGPAYPHVTTPRWLPQPHSHYVSTTCRAATHFSHVWAHTCGRCPHAGPHCRHCHPTPHWLHTSQHGRFLGISLQAPTRRRRRKMLHHLGSLILHNRLPHHHVLALGLRKVYDTLSNTLIVPLDMACSLRHENQPNLLMLSMIVISVKQWRRNTWHCLRTRLGIFLLRAITNI
jgi:hypothetical protein